MQLHLRALLVLFMVFAAGCSDGGDSSDTPPRSSVTIDGTPVVFNTSLHFYFLSTDETKIDLSGSNPPGWFIEFYWPGDVGPASADTALGELEIYVDPPTAVSGELHWANDTTTQAVTLDMVKFGFDMGQPTEGLFSGSVGGTIDPANIFVLEDGVFLAVRQN